MPLAALVALWLTIASTLLPVTAAAQVIYQDNFESGVSGWSNNSSETHPAYSRYLGRFDNNPNQTSRTFAVPAGSQSLVIAFDFYRFDSWDDTAQWGFDRFQIDVNGTQIFSLPFSPQPPSLTGSNGNVSWVFTQVGTSANRAYGTWDDLTFRVTITIANPPTSVAFTLRTALNQGGNDEAGGFDNFRVEAFPYPPSVTITKSSAREPPSVFNVPGANIIYTVEVRSTGGGLDAGSLRLTDLLPPGITLFTGNFDGAGNAVAFTDLSSPPSGITCCSAANLAYSDEAVPPQLFDYAPAGSLDPAVRGLRIVPGGQARQGVTSQVVLRFRFRGTIR